MQNDKNNMNQEVARVLSECESTGDDYMDFNIRRISIKGKRYELKNKIFETPIAINLYEGQEKIVIENCEFKKGFFLRSMGKEGVLKYDIFIFRSTILGECSFAAFEEPKTVSIDTCKIKKVNLIGKSNKIEIYRSEITTLYLENEECEYLTIDNSIIEKFSLFRIKIKDVNIDNTELAISDYNRFIPSFGQDKKDVSEIYHKLVLRCSNSINESRKINYELSKATSSKYLVLFGYFFNPFYVFYWMLGIISVFSVLYWLILNESIEKSIYFSIYTFLTIGFGDIAGEHHLFLKSILVFFEGFLGILYCAVFLTTIINSSKK
jgi:hypothetical protein